MSAAAADDPLRVLVIDDDKNLAEAIAESLERKGHAVTVATTGKAGAAKVEADEFDVVLTDLKMADLDGLTFTPDHGDWWFNLRPSNTEPLLRLNAEGRDRATMQRVRDEILTIIRSAS